MAYTYRPALSNVGMLARGILGDEGFGKNLVKAVQCKLVDLPTPMGYKYDVDLALSRNGTLTISTGGDKDAGYDACKIIITTEDDEYETLGYSITTDGDELFVHALSVSLILAMRDIDRVADGQHRVTAWNKMQKMGNLIVLNRDVSITEAVDQILRHAVAC